MSEFTEFIRVSRRLSQSLRITLLLTCCSLAAQTNEHHIRNIVLVHGAWADGCRGQLEFFEGIQQRLVKGLRADARLRERVERLQSIRKHFITGRDELMNCSYDRPAWFPPWWYSPVAHGVAM